VPEAPRLEVWSKSWYGFKSIKNILFAYESRDKIPRRGGNYYGRIYIYLYSSLARVDLTLGWGTLDPTLKRGGRGDPYRELWGKSILRNIPIIG
jgi:hypothetical protein